MSPKLSLRHQISRAVLDIGRLTRRRSCVIYPGSQNRGHEGCRILGFEMHAKLSRQHTPSYPYMQGSAYKPFLTPSSVSTRILLNMLVVTEQSITLHLVSAKPTFPLNFLNEGFLFAVTISAFLEFSGILCDAKPLPVQPFLKDDQ